MRACAEPRTGAAVSGLTHGHNIATKFALTPTSLQKPHLQSDHSGPAGTPAFANLPTSQALSARPVTLVHSTASFQPTTRDCHSLVIPTICWACEPAKPLHSSLCGSKQTLPIRQLRWRPPLSTPSSNPPSAPAMIHHPTLLLWGRLARTRFSLLATTLVPNWTRAPV